MQRGLRQIDMANLIGLEPSYLSALECGHKPPPSKKRLDYLLANLNLDDAEEKAIIQAAKVSSNKIIIPKKAKMQTLEVCQLFQEVLPRISDLQLEIIKFALQLPYREEEPKMLKK